MLTSACGGDMPGVMNIGTAGVSVGIAGSAAGASAGAAGGGATTMGVADDTISGFFKPLSGTLPVDNYKQHGNHAQRNSRH